jgi:gluconokinase
MADRRDHYMPGSLLDSQLEALQPLEADENGIVVELDSKSLDQEAEEIITRLGISARPRGLS